MKTWTLADVAAHWDATPDYDAVNAKIDSYLRRFYDSAPLFTIPDSARVLDVDCRTGNGTVFFRERFPTAHFTCIAMAPTFVARARKNLDAHGIDAPVSLMTDPPWDIPDASFDVVLSYETLEHVPWPGRYITELARVLRPGGTLVLTTPNLLWEPVHWLSATLHLDHGEGPHRMLPRGEILRYFKATGLTIETERTFVLVPAGPKWLLGIGKWKESWLPEGMKKVFCLRRTFVCRKEEGREVR